MTSLYATPVAVAPGTSFWDQPGVGSTPTPSTADYSQQIIAQAQAQVDAALGQFGSSGATDYSPISAGPVGGSTPAPITAPVGGGSTTSGSGGDTSATGAVSKPGGTVGPSGTSGGASSLSLGTGGLNIAHVLILLALLGGAYYLIGHRKGNERWAGGRK